MAFLEMRQINSVTSIAFIQACRALRALPSRCSTPRCFSTSAGKQADFTHAVIGGGAVGLAIARQLSLSRPESSTLLIERHGMIGSETSSRNSEVIHAGLYYGHNTLKTDLCLEGKHALYDLCAKYNIPHRRTKKWILAQDEQQMGELNKVHKFAQEVGHDQVPTCFLSRREVEAQEPDVRAEAGVLESSSTGIIDSHAYMQFLEGDFLEHEGSEALHTSVSRIEKLPSGGYRIYTVHSDNSSQQHPLEETSIDVDILINSAGLAAIPLSNSILPSHRWITPHYAKGTYFSYSSSHPKPKTLLYPAPIPGHGGLGTHLTLDMAGAVRFGPDVEWIDSPDAPDALKPSPARFEEAISIIKTYLPSIDPSAINLDYCGIRPKLGRTSGTAGPTFADFYIKEEKEDGFEGFVNLLGIESPGLTSSLAIGRYVERLLYGSQQQKNDTIEEAKERGRAGQKRHEFAQ